VQANIVEGDEGAGAATAPGSPANKDSTAECPEAADAAISHAEVLTPASLAESGQGIDSAVLCCRRPTNLSIATAEAAVFKFKLQPNGVTRDASTAPRFMQALAMSKEQQAVSSKPASAQIAVLVGSASTADPIMQLP
jgi:hypothetical protein